MFANDSLKRDRFSLFLTLIFRKNRVSLFRIVLRGSFDWSPAPVIRDLDERTLDFVARRWPSFASREDTLLQRAQWEIRYECRQSGTALRNVHIRRHLAHALASLDRFLDSFAHDDDAIDLSRHVDGGRWVPTGTGASAQRIRAPTNAA